MFDMLALDVAPPAADASGASFMLWGILVLMGALGTVVLFVVKKVKDNEKKCETESAKCDADRKEYRDTISGHHKKVEAIYQTIIQEKDEASKTKAQLLAENAMALRRNAEAYDRNTELFNRIIGKGDL